MVCSKQLPPAINYEPSSELQKAAELADRNEVNLKRYRVKRAALELGRELGKEEIETVLIEAAA